MTDRSSSALPLAHVHYPESDGEPMGETDKHIDETIAFRLTLAARYESAPDVYVAGNNLIYYDRIHARPEGLEIVLAEDETDPQASALAASMAGPFVCNPARLSIAAGDPPEPFALVGTIEVPAEALTPTEPTCRR